VNITGKNSFTPKIIYSFHATIFFTKLTLSELLVISSIEVCPTRTNTVECTEKISLTLSNDVWLSLHRFSRNTNLLNGAVSRRRENFTQNQSRIMAITGRNLFDEEKPNCHCGDFHEIDAHSAPFSKENLYQFFFFLEILQIAFADTFSKTE
jgi:hypothetical protein